MAMSRLRSIDRRMAIGAGLVSAAGLALPFRQSQGRVVTQRGMAGGGLVQFDRGEANFSLFASRLIFEDEKLEVVAGSVLWTDAPAGLSMESVEVTGYNVPEDQPALGQSRQIIGMMSVNGEDEYPFELVVIDAGAPGSGPDTVTLTVGDGARAGDNATPVAGMGFSYLATGPVSTGDVQEIAFVIDTVAGVSRPAAPPD